MRCGTGEFEISVDRFKIVGLLPNLNSMGPCPTLIGQGHCFPFVKKTTDLETTGALDLCPN